MAKKHKNYYEHLVQKRARFLEFTNTRKQVFLTFITNHGMVENKYATELVDASVVLEDLFD